MMKKSTVTSLKISVVPAMLASSCCMAFPALVLLGFSASEAFFAKYIMEIRAAAVVLFVLMLVGYLYLNGITSVKNYKKNRKIVLFTVVQTTLFACVIYAFSLYLLTPILYKVIGQSCPTCAII